MFISAQEECPAVCHNHNVILTNSAQRSKSPWYWVAEGSTKGSSRRISNLGMFIFV